LPFTEWETFYVIVGSSAAALTGLMFVVMALIVDFRSSEQQLEAFGTPTVVHFCSVLLLSAIMSAPWHTMSGARLALGSCGAAGVVYMLIVVRRAYRQTGYEPVIEDWLFHTVLPLAAYAGIIVAAFGLPRRPTTFLFAIGAVTALLLFVGIHNAWDTVTYIVVQRWEEKQKQPRDQEPS
jgi:predicted membrane channel-forming protein YqfA (hemolysin III family)